MAQLAARAIATPGLPTPTPRTIIGRAERPAPRELLQRCTVDRGSPAWDELLDGYGRHVEIGVRAALRRFGRRAEPALIEDLTQEAYCRLVEDGARRLRTFRGTVPAELGAWLQKLAERTAHDHLRAEAAGKRGGDRVLPRSALAEEPRDPVACPQCRVEQRERLRAFARRCRALIGDAENARILELVLIEGWTSKDVVRASRGAVSRSRVDSLVYRLRCRLREEGYTLAIRGSGGRRSAP